jgi:hypothetical protein
MASETVKPKWSKGPHTTFDAGLKVKAMLELELERQPDGRWKYRPAEDGAIQTDETIAAQAGAAPNWVATHRKKHYKGGFVPQHHPKPVLIAPNLEAPPPMPATLEQRVIQHASAINKNANVQAGHTEQLKQLGPALERIAVLEAHVKELREGLGIAV